MTRPRKATVDYFPHSVNHGKTMFILEEQWGNDGYTFWFKILELLGASENHVYDAGNPAAWRFLTSKTRVSGETAADILQCLAELEAIDPELWSEKIIWSQNFVDGIKEAYKKREGDIPIRPDIRNRKSQTKRITGDENPQTRLKETKVKEIKIKKPSKSFLPNDFKISEEVKTWASKHGHLNLNQHLEAFIELCKSNGYTAVDWDSKFKRAIREDWGKINQGNGQSQIQDHCINHPNKRGTATLDGRWYCRSCLDNIEKKQFDGLDGRINSLAEKMKMENFV